MTDTPWDLPRARAAQTWHVRCFSVGDFVMNRTRSERGFTLVEMAVALLILGMLMAFSVPAFQSLNKTNQLHGATENIAANMKMMREKAIATGRPQPVHMTENFPAGKTWDYHVHNVEPPVVGWDLPRGVTYASAGPSPTFKKDGRAYVDSNSTALTSGLIILRNERGERDTVALLSSGQILVR